MDWTLLLLGALLGSTLAAFFLGIFPYPFGWLIFAGMFCLRLYQINRRDR